MQDSCPVNMAHKRLMDCHAHWHMTAKSYLDPEGFRLNLNSLIQSLRNVTWILQKQKKDLDNFDSWYPEWQASVADDSIMKWIVKARNRIVKEADLEIYSEAKFKLSLNWNSGFEKTYSMPLRYSTEEMVQSALSSNPLQFPGMIFSLERRWVDKMLPEYELLDATRHAYAKIARVIFRAHMEQGHSQCQLPDREESCVTSEFSESPICFFAADKFRKTSIDIDNMTEIHMEMLKIEQTEEAKALAAEKYGDFEIHGDAIERVPQIVESSKAILRKDENLLPFIWILKGDQLVHFFGVHYQGTASKRVAMENLAEFLKHVDADGIVHAGEIWLRPLTPEGSAWNSDGNLNDPIGEAVLVVGLTKDGRELSGMVPFYRNEEGETHFEETSFDESSSNFMKPIRRAWGN